MSGTGPQFHSHCQQWVRVAPDHLVPPPDSLARPPGQLEAGGYKTSIIRPIFKQYTGENKGRKQCLHKAKS